MSMLMVSLGENLCGLCTSDIARCLLRLSSGDRDGSLASPSCCATRATYASVALKRIPQMTYFRRTWITRVLAHSPNRVENCFSEICA